MSELSNRQELVQHADELFRKLFPICRSITGPGVRDTLNILRSHMPELEIQEVPSGTQVFDWVVPREWVVQSARLEAQSGECIADFANCNIHLVSYSQPFEGLLSYDELLPHLHTLPNLPEAIPYRTSYYKDDWGICLTHRDFEKLDRNEKYRVKIDTEFKDGSLSYGECRLDGSSGREFLISTYCCHPSMANDNLSGPILTALLYSELKQRKLNHNYRFVICPETIGAIAYLSRNESAMRKIDGGFVITTTAGPGRLGYKKSFIGDHEVDRAVDQAFKDRGIEPVVYPFVPDGSDERQYSSPGFRIPVTSITKDKYYEYEFYHTSLDDLDFVSGIYLVESLQLYLDTIDILEKNVRPVNLLPNGEVRLGIRGLYPQTGGAQKQSANGENNIKHDDVDLITWILFLSDSHNDLLNICKRSNGSFSRLHMLCEKLKEAGVLELNTMVDGLTSD